jgi:hypothetical protein
MLYSIDEKRIEAIPKRRQADFRRWRTALGEDNYQIASDAIRNRLDEKEVVVAAWLPGKDWTGTPFEPLYYACNRNEEQSGWFFGLIVWDVMIHHSDDWFFLPAADEDDVLGMRYFRKRTE